MNNPPFAQLIATLQHGLTIHPHTALAYLTAWLDPLCVSDLTSDPGSGEPDELLLHALEVCRTCFPALYATVAQLAATGADYRQLELHLCAGVGQQLEVAPDTLDAFAYGVLFQPMGVEYGPDFAENYPSLVPILHWMGLDPEEGCDGQTPLLERLIKELETLTHDETAQDIVCLLHWLYGSSGNTAVDFSNEAFWDSGIDGADWTPDNIAFMNELHAEARRHIDRALRGAQTLADQPQWRRAFQRNCQRLRGDLDVTGTVRLHWPARARRGAEPATDPAT